MIVLSKRKDNADGHTDTTFFIPLFLSNVGQFPIIKLQHATHSIAQTLYTKSCTRRERGPIFSFYGCGRMKLSLGVLIKTNSTNLAN